jgi:hypothetical protein
MTSDPGGTGWVVREVVAAPTGGSYVTLIRTRGGRTELPPIGTVASFSVHHFTSSFANARLDREPPWPLRPVVAAPEPPPIEAADADSP